MFEVIMENLIQILTAIVLAGINIGGAYLLKMIGKQQSMKAIEAATQTVLEMTAVTCGELQQTLVCALKEAREDGKLTREDIVFINQQLLEKVRAKLSVPAYDLINAAGADIEAMILGAAEAWVSGIKGNG